MSGCKICGKPLNSSSVYCNDHSSVRSLVATEVLKWEYIQDGLYRDDNGNQVFFNPLKDLNDAWLVVEKLDKDRKFLYVSNVASGWKCNIEADRWYAIAETAPLAICLASLKCMGIDI